MAGKRPSKRRHAVNSDVELKLVPVMSLLVVLVPMLLQTAVFEKTAAIQVNLPSADDPVRYLDDPTPEALAQALTLAMTSEGFLLLSGEETLGRIPATASGLDFPALAEALRAAKSRFPVQEAIVLLIEDGIVYDDIVHAMDRCRPFFPAVSLADRVEGGGE